MITRRQFASLTGAGMLAPIATPALAQAQGARVLRVVPQQDLITLDPVTTTAYIAGHSDATDATSIDLNT